jgi:3-hydroxy-9,10-secoandrosta-1,3,5(10)-triene-9,17-dione monooxygenase reductase component
MPVHEQTYREAIAAFATGVTVITTTVEGKPVGMTASAVASLSLDPVLLLVCISTHLPTHTALEHAGRFAVNVLEEGHEHLARKFARRAEDKFDGVPLRPGHDLPVLEESMAHFICNVHERFPGGDHTIFIGEVTDCAHDPTRRPLLYFRSSFGRIDDPDAAYERHAGVWDVLI